MEELTQTTSPDESVHGDSNKPRSINFGLVAVFTLVLAFLAVVGLQLAGVYEGPLESGKAPDFTLVTFDGESITLSELRGRVVIINFWASWCPPCREEAAYLEQTWRKYKDQGVVFIGVAYADAEKNALAYIQEFDITYFNGHDLGTRISGAYNILGVPETFYVTKSGEITGVKIGPLYPPELDMIIVELLQEDYP